MDPTVCPTTATTTSLRLIRVLQDAVSVQNTSIRLFMVLQVAVSVQDNSIRLIRVMHGAVSVQDTSIRLIRVSQCACDLGLDVMVAEQWELAEWLSQPPDSLIARGRNMYNWKHTVLKFWMS